MRTVMAFMGKTYEEVNGKGHEKESDRGVEEISHEERTPLLCGKIRLANDGANERREEIFGEGTNDGAECSADDHANCEIDDVAAHDELLEA